MPVRIDIAGVNKATSIALSPSVNISLLQNGRSRMRFACEMGYEPARFSEVVAYAQDGITPIYGGVILQRSLAAFVAGEVPDSQMTIEAVGFEAYLDWCFVDLVYTTDTNLQVVLNALVALLPAGYGITLDAVDYSGILLSAFSWKNMRVSDALRELCDRTGRIYRVSPLKVLSVPVPGYENAPYAITDAEPHCKEISWRDPTTPPASVVKLICGPSGNQSVTKTFDCDGYTRSWSWEVPSCAAGTIPAEPAKRANCYLGVNTGQNFSDGETVTIDGVTYTYKTVAGGTNEVTIGGDANASLDNLAAVAVGHPTCDIFHPADRDRMLWAVCKTPGAAGNNIQVSETADQAFWYGEGTIPRSTFQLGADATFSIGSYAYSWTAWIIHNGLTIETDPNKRYVLVELADSGNAGWQGLFDAPNLTLSIDTAWNDADIPVVNGVIGAGHYIWFEYTGAFPFTISSGPGTPPEIVHVETRPEIVDVARAYEILEGLLATYGASPRELEVISLDNGWAPGQALTVDLILRNLIDTTFAITEVTIDLIEKDYWEYRFNATELSVFPGSYVDQWRALLAGSASGSSSGSSSGVSTVTSSGGGGATQYYLGGSRFHAVQLPE
jgi:hypothetical protein